jgi:hypothetical protein
MRLDGDAVAGWAFGCVGFALVVGLAVGFLVMAFGDHRTGHYKLDPWATTDSAGRHYEYRVLEHLRYCEDDVLLQTDDYDRALALWRELEATCPRHSR